MRSAARNPHDRARAICAAPPPGAPRLSTPKTGGTLAAASRIPVKKGRPMAASSPDQKDFKQLQRDLWLRTYLMGILEFDGETQASAPGRRGPRRGDGLPRRRVPRAAHQAGIKEAPGSARPQRRGRRARRADRDRAQGARPRAARGARHPHRGGRRVVQAHERGQRRLAQGQGPKRLGVLRALRRRDRLHPQAARRLHGRLPRALRRMARPVRARHGRLVYDAFFKKVKATVVPSCTRSPPASSRTPPISGRMWTPIPSSPSPATSWGSSASTPRARCSPASSTPSPTAWPPATCASPRTSTRTTS